MGKSITTHIGGGAMRERTWRAGSGSRPGPKLSQHCSLPAEAGRHPRRAGYDERHGGPPQHHRRHAVDDGEGSSYIALGDGLDDLHFVGLTRNQLLASDFVV